ncbi:hypothetical protein [Aquimarina spinulae]|uniref:hypothetical protein n=1 Tax=Aquimarina spinulae TaxID=1192023 RepID=UPI000D55A0C4|nr:hypothetical protein [Aquimarina spinulae]
MNEKKVLLSMFLTVVLLYSCNKKESKSKPNSDPVIDLFKKNLIETKIGGSNLYISLPTNYKIEENLGPDFKVYHFKHIDTNSVQNLSGGFYLGYHPSEFAPDNDDCKTEFSESEVFNKQRKWRIYDCNGEFSMQSIIINESNEIWNEKIHAFGNATTKNDLDKLMKIYSTLNKK